MLAGTRFSKAPETLRARKAILSSSVSKNGEVYAPETFCMKGAYVYRFEILLLLYGPEHFPWFSRNEPLAIIRPLCDFRQIEEMLEETRILEFIMQGNTNRKTNVEKA